MLLLVSISLIVVRSLSVAAIVDSVQDSAAHILDVDAELLTKRQSDQQGRQHRPPTVTVHERLVPLFGQAMRVMRMS